MDTDRLLACFRQDGPRLIAAAQGNLDAPVPNCPGWAVRDAVLHVAEVYQHKIVALKEGKRPDPWPRDIGDVEPIAYLQSSFEAMLGEFLTRPPDERAWTWAAGGEGDVAWWIRRMAQETAVHRVDVEQAAGVQTPIDPDLAVDGVDEMLGEIFPAIQSNWPEAFSELLGDARGEIVSVRTGGREWRVGLHQSGVDLEPAGAAAATVEGEPEAVLLWLWGRVKDDGVTLDGEKNAIALLRQALSAAGQ